MEQHVLAKIRNLNSEPTYPIFMRFFNLMLIIGVMVLSVLACGSKQKKIGENELAQTMLPKDYEPKDTTSFESQFVLHFRSADLPLEISSQYQIEDTIPVDVVLDNILEAAALADLNAFEDLWGNPEIQEITRKGLQDRYIDVEKNAFAVINFGYLYTLPLSEDFHSLVFKYIPMFMEGSYVYTYLANYTPEGKLIDVVRIGGTAGYVDMEQEWKSTIQENGEIEVKTQVIKKGDMYGEDRDFVEKALVKYQMSQSGKFEIINQNFSSFSGSFQAKNSGEVFRIEEYFGDVNILYQPDPESVNEKELEVLEIDRQQNKITTRLPNSDQKMVLSYDSTRSHFVCNQSQGKAKEFVRMEL